MVMTPIIINTRPLHRGDDIRTMDGVRVVDLPLLDIKDTFVNINDKNNLLAWQNDQYNALIVTSVESASRAIKHLNKLTKKPSTPMIAVGKATAHCLTSAGFMPILPTTANNEGMLRLPQINSLTTGDQVLIWSGVGGRRLLHDTLTERGVHIDVITWYERTRPSLLDDNFERIGPILKTICQDKDTPIYVLISSQMAFTHWQSLAHQALDQRITERYHYLTLGERLKKIVSTACPDNAASLIHDLSKEHLGMVIAQG
ncbi:uroporphyrinogen-III synthase [Moraxella sp. Tifton1]|uniref:uroporphyrinogen-III synthase n=1 Tax=Moraxella oculi TaxID=2940516 RepID=UPI002012AB6B|nr:uroporphyrinogen-III synthase [Moraxella sp. Tifton1]MCL1623839.1 uroporphyrinogen-III synthase [Moraxella sp. Tifton1]